MNFHVSCKHCAWHAFTHTAQAGEDQLRRHHATAHADPGIEDLARAVGVLR